MKRSQDGVSLDGVGLIHPDSTAAASRRSETPSLDELMQKHTGTEDHLFEEPPMRRPDYSHGYIELIYDASKQAAKDVVSHLKERGRWCERFDRQGLPLLFAEAAGTPAFEPLVCFVESLVDHLDPMGELLYECARYLARERKISLVSAGRSGQSAFRALHHGWAESGCARWDVGRADFSRAAPDGAPILSAGAEKSRVAGGDR